MKCTMFFPGMPWLGSLFSRLTDIHNVQIKSVAAVFRLFLGRQRRKLLTVILVLFFQAGRSDKEAPQGHEEEHGG